MNDTKIYASSISLVNNGEVVGSFSAHDGKIVVMDKDGAIQNSDISSAGSGGGGNTVFSDNWFSSAMTSQPPTPGITGPADWNPIDINVVRTNTEIGFWVQNPKQVLFGDILVPYINNIRITIPSANGNPLLDVLNSGTYIPTGNSPIEAFVISKIKSTGYYANDGAYSKDTYVYSNSNIGNYIIDNKINVNIWFENTVDKNRVPNVLTVPLYAFLEAFPPSVVRNVSFVNISSTGTTVNWLNPQFTAGDNNNANITNYKIDYVSTSSPNRYVYVGQTGSAVVGNTGTTVLTNLIPGTNYTTVVSAKNDIAAAYGPGGTGTFITANPAAPAVPGSITLTLPISNFHSNIKRVDTNAVISNPVYSFGATGGNCNALTNFPIHSSTNIGSTGTNLMNFDFLINGVSQYKINFNGFGVNPAFTTNIATDNKALFSTPTIADAGSGNTTNFYNRVSSITPSLALNNGTPFAAGNTGSAQINYFLSPSTNISSAAAVFYVDDLSKTPTVASPVLTDSFMSKKITGITIVGANSNQNLNYTVNAQNFARYFYRSDKIISLNNSTTGVTTNNSLITVLPVGTPYPIPVDTDVSFTGAATVSFNSTNFSYGIVYTASVFSPFTTAGSSHTSGSVIINKLYDGPSYNKTIINAIPKVGDIGCRVLSQNPISVSPNPASHTLGHTLYDNDASLVSGVYLNELPIILGKYTSSIGNATYLDNCATFGGVSYSSIKNETGFRYMTYAWDVDMTKSTALTTLRFIFSGFNGNNKLTRNTTTSSIETANAFNAYYRFEQLDSSGVPLPAETETSTPTRYTSYWIDANKFGSNFVGFINKPANNGIGGLIFSGGDVSPINTPTSADFTYNVLARSITPSTSGVSGLRIYFMVGVAMNSGISFNDVKCTFT